MHSKIQGTVAIDWFAFPQEPPDRSQASSLAGLTLSRSRRAASRMALHICDITQPYSLSREYLVCGLLLRKSRSGTRQLRGKAPPLSQSSANRGLVNTLLRT